MIAEANKMVPLTPKMLQVSHRLYSKLQDWVSTEAALRQLAKSFPLESDNYFTILVKATSLNALYGTYIMDIKQVAKHFYNHLSKLRECISSEFIDSDLSRVQFGKHTYRLTSFTSKYCHFFIDESKFPMYDEFAAIAIVKHLGLPLNKCWVGNYAEYCKYIQRLLDVSYVRPTYAELDHHLWLTGQWQTWSEGKNVNQEVGTLFEQIMTEPERNKEEIAVLKIKRI